MVGIFFAGLPTATADTPMRSSAEVGVYLGMEVAASVRLHAYEQETRLQQTLSSRAKRFPVSSRWLVTAWPLHGCTSVGPRMAVGMVVTLQKAWRWRSLQALDLALRQTPVNSQVRKVIKAARRHESSILRESTATSIASLHGVSRVT